MYLLLFSLPLDNTQGRNCYIMAVPVLIFCGNSILSSAVAALIHIPANSASGFPLLHMSAHVCICGLSDNSHSSRSEKIPLWLWCAIPWWSLRLSIFSVGLRMFSLGKCLFNFSVHLLGFYGGFLFFVVVVFVFLLFLGPLLAAYGGSQARGWIGAVATRLRQSHSNAGSEPHLQATPQLTATPDR